MFVEQCARRYKRSLWTKHSLAVLERARPYKKRGAQAILERHWYTRKLFKTVSFSLVCEKVLRREVGGGTRVSLPRPSSRSFRYKKFLKYMRREANKP